MRLLRLVAEDQFAVELHPLVTVLTGLDPDQKDTVLRAAAAAAVGRVDGMSGLIEAHDLVLDLDATSLGLLDLAEAPNDVVVDGNDLPGAGGTGLDRQIKATERRLDAARAALGAATAELDEVTRRAQAAVVAREQIRTRARQAVDARRDHASGAEELAQRRAEADRRAGDLVPARAQAEAEFEAATERHQAAVAARDEALKERTLAVRAIEVAEVHLADVRDRRDPFASSAVEAARHALAELEAAIADERASAKAHLAAVAGSGGETPAEAVARIEAARAEIDDLLPVLDAFDPEPVHAALDLVRAGGDEAALVPSAEAQELAEQLEAIDRRIAGATEVQAPSPADLAAARARVEDAQAALAEAEQLARGPHLDADLVAALEEAHEAVLAAQDRIDSRFGAARAAKRLADAREAEQTLLDQLGFGTYADYMMGTSILHRDESEPRRELAQAELVEAEAALADLESMVDVELELAAWRDQRRSLRSAAHALLGAPVPDDELIAALRALRVPDEDRFSPSGELRAALVAVGLAVGDLDAGVDDLVELAEDWLGEHARAQRHREALLAQRAELEAEAQAAVARQADLDAMAAGPDPEAVFEERLDAARAALAIAEDRLAAHEAAEEAIAQATDELEMRTRESEAGLAAVDHARTLEQEAAAVVDRAQSILDQVVAAHQAALSEVEAIDQELERLDALAREAESTDFAAAIAAAEHDAEVAEAAVHERRAAHQRIQAQHDEVADELAALRTAVLDRRQDELPIEEIEWYLLARLAGQRHVSFAGSVPLVLDNALAAVDDAGLVHLLDRLERMAGAVQVIHVTDDPRVVAWAERAGDQRVAVVTPVHPHALSVNGD